MELRSIRIWKLCDSELDKCNGMGKYNALQTHNLLRAKHNDENDFESNLNTLQEKYEAGQKLARHHLETC